MMLDWFVLLTPLLVLPIVLLFVFVGCTLDTRGAGGVPLFLQYDAGFQTDVQSIAVQFTYQDYDESAVFHEVLKGNGVANAVIWNDSIDPAGNLLSALSDILLEDRAPITCWCVVATSPAPSDESVPATLIALDPKSKEKPEDEDPPVFYLHRQGSTFVVD